MTITKAGTCLFRDSAGVLCTERTVASIKAQVPGGVIRGGACKRHVEQVRQMVNTESERRWALSDKPRPTTPNRSA